MPAVPIPPDEVGRLLSLASYDILDTPPEVHFDDLTSLASHICQTPVSLITLIDKDRQWFKSHPGVDLTEMPRELSFCAHAIVGPEVMVVENALEDPRFADNPIVAGGPKVRFYAGAPLTMPDGHALGTLCVIDLVPRNLRADEAAALRSLSRQVVSQLILRKNSRSLGVAERYQRSTIDAIDACVCTLDEQGRVLSTNRAWRAWDGGAGFMDRCDIGGAYFSAADRLLVRETVFTAAVSAGLRSVIAGDAETFVQEYRLSNSESDRWVQIKATRFEAGGQFRLAVVHEDVTERRRAVAFAVERRALRDAVASMEQVLGIVGHELRTPLAGLRAMTDYVLDPASRATSDWEPFLRSIGDEVIRMSDTVDTLLEAARLNSGKARWAWATVDLSEVCHDVLEQFKLLYPGTSVRLEATIDPATGPMLGDAAAVHRLLANLIANALKFTVAGSICIAVGPWVLDGSAAVQITVTDTGTGIPPETLARLGHAFELNSGIVGQNHVSGTGLGMAICKAIVSAHGGMIHVDSAVGVGTTVTIFLRSDLAEPDTTASENLFTGSAQLTPAA